MNIRTIILSNIRKIPRGKRGATNPAYITKNNLVKLRTNAFSKGFVTIDNNSLNCASICFYLYKK